MTNNEISELVLKVQKFNDLDSYNQLLKKFDNLINSTAYYVIKKVPRVSVSKEDLVNILSYAFYELTKEYDPEKGMHYATYMKVNLNYKAHNYVRSLISKSHQVMNNSVAFNDEAYEQVEEEDSGVLEDIRTNYKNYNWLTDIEKKVLGLMLEEYETSEIAEELNISNSRVYKAKKAISIKLKKKLEL